MKKIHIGLLVALFALAVFSAPFTYSAVKSIYAGKQQPGYNFGDIDHGAHHSAP